MKVKKEICIHFDQRLNNDLIKCDISTSDNLSMLLPLMRQSD